MRRLGLVLGHFLVWGGSLYFPLAWSAAPPESQSSPRPKITSGWVEKIRLLPSQDILKAKLDTGAKTSSINARDIRRFKRDGDKWASFELHYKTADGELKSFRLERPIARNIRVKEHDRENARRPVVELDFCFNGRAHRTQFSLVDRSKFVYPVLLGRRFLSGVAVIDPARTFLTAAHCDTPSVSGPPPS